MLPTTIADMDAVACLLVSADPLLVADVQRLAAAAGVVPDVVADAPSALAGWGHASVVLVGADVVAPLAGAAPERRSGVHLVCSDRVDDGLFRHALALGAESVVSLADAGPWLVERLGDAADGTGLPGSAVAVVGGAGGAGASTLAVALADTLARRGPTLLVDLDPLGPGLDRVLGLEGAEGVRWDALLRATGRLSSRSLRESLPGDRSLSVLTWPTGLVSALEPSAVREVFAAARRGYEWVVVDLPRHRDRAADEALGRCDRLVLVSNLSVATVTAASRLVRGLPPVPAARALVTRGRNGVRPEAASRLLDVPLLVAMGNQRGIDESVDLGAGPVTSDRGPLARAARAVASWLDATEPVRRGVA